MARKQGIEAVQGERLPMMNVSADSASTYRTSGNWSRPPASFA